MKRAFTLIELMISIAILSILMLFLYKSYAELNLSNKIYTTALGKIQKSQKLKKVLYLDFLVAEKKSMLIDNVDKESDFVSFMSRNSLHRRIEPYICYLVKNKKLYRLESRLQITSRDINRDIAFDIDEVGEVSKFKLFKTRDNKGEFYLLDLKLKKKAPIIMKLKVLN
jgi:prepilin-type N-terminal cleavage/methylation domain-containing protein